MLTSDCAELERAGWVRKQESDMSIFLDSYSTKPLFRCHLKAWPDHGPRIQFFFFNLCTTSWESSYSHGVLTESLEEGLVEWPEPWLQVKPLQFRNISSGP